MLASFAARPLAAGSGVELQQSEVRHAATNCDSLRRQSPWTDGTQMYIILPPYNHFISPVWDLKMVGSLIYTSVVPQQSIAHFDWNLLVMVMQSCPRLLNLLKFHVTFIPYSSYQFISVHIVLGLKSSWNILEHLGTSWNILEPFPSKILRSWKFECDLRGMKQ